MAITCPGCKRTFQNDRSYSAHYYRCPDFKNLQAQMFETLANNLMDETMVLDALDVRNDEGTITTTLDDDSGAQTHIWDESTPNTMFGIEQRGVNLATKPAEASESYTSGRPMHSAHARRLPARYIDELPPVDNLAPQQDDDEALEEHHDGLLPPMDIDLPEDNDSRSQASPSSNAPSYYDSDKNSFGIFHSFLGQPGFIPHNTLDLLCDSPNFGNRGEKAKWWRGITHRLSFTSDTESDDENVPDPKQDLPSLDELNANYFKPFPNPSLFLLMNWFYSGSTSKTLAELERLVKDVILDKDFNIADIEGFSVQREAQRVDIIKDADLAESLFATSDGWRKVSIKIHVPFERVKHASETAAPAFDVEFLHYRPILDVIKAVLQDPNSQHYHLHPFKTYWQPDGARGIMRVYSELYNSDAYIEEHERLRQTHTSSTHENVIAAIMLWSDSTHLANFGTASLWPIYLFLGNLSKYMHCKPGNFAAHHIAYIPKLSDKIQEFCRFHFNQAATSHVLSYLRRELMHNIWSLLLDSEFIGAYVDGVLVKFFDGVVRRVFFRIFTYSADYPEKVLLSCIKFLAKYPCPTCLVPKEDIRNLGKKRDMLTRAHKVRVDNEEYRQKIQVARKYIYESGRYINGRQIAALLGTMSLVPTLNAFSSQLSMHGFNFFSLFVPDLLHEFELGVWKAVFTHLIRILYAKGEDTIQILNERYRKVPPFGRAIRRFHSNASAMKKLAGRDFEDLLQCAMPVFEGLLDAPHDAIVRELLFELVTWHALAKLRLHTEATIKALEHSTRRLGKAIRRFDDETCSAFETYELPSEEAARGRRRRRTARPSTADTTQMSARKVRNLNLGTYKLHALGHYADAIRRFGPSDSYSTQTGEAEHRRVKKYYRRVSKSHVTMGIAKQNHRERILRKINQRKQMRDVLEKEAESTKPPVDISSKPNPSRTNPEQENLAYTAPEAHHHISTEGQSRKLSTWLSDREEDVACKDFYIQLKNHLRTRLLGLEYDGDEQEYTATERNEVTIKNDLIYEHKVLRINYTTYDMRRDQDVLKPHANFTILANETQTSYPYWYGRLIGILHADVIFQGKSERMEFLWVRWLGRDLGGGYQEGWRTRQLPRVGFMPHVDPAAFGFLDPNLVIRAIHLIPAFSHGRTKELLPFPSVARLPEDNNEDWEMYYVGIFVDRDMAMRFRGGGVGHKSVRKATDYFKKDRFPEELVDDVELEQEDDPMDADGEHPAQDGHRDSKEHVDDEIEANYESEDGEDTAAQLIAEFGTGSDEEVLDDAEDERSDEDDANSQLEDDDDDDEQDELAAEENGSDNGYAEL